MGRSSPKTEVAIKRVYAAPARSDGKRILVDRLWPRGLSKADAEVDLWLKEVAPSTELRKWFGHEPARWGGFQSRYEAELAEHAERLAEVLDVAAAGPVTLVFAAKDEERNQAVVLQRWLNARLG